MHTEQELFSRLLPVVNFFDLYKKVGESIVTEIDLRNAGYDHSAMNNSVKLLMVFGLVVRNGKRFVKTKKTVKNLAEFKKTLLIELDRLMFEESIFKESQMTFDESESKFYLARNSVPLSLSGLLMLLNSVGRVTLKDSRVYINDDGTIEKHRKTQVPQRRTITLIGLKNKLAIRDELGAEAEALALKYEKDQLLQQNITRDPIKVSDLDAAAGYDIASFSSVKSKNVDKFIEVKSCMDATLCFYMSKNEIEKAKILRKSYYLYLFDRGSDRFTIVQNPYDAIVSGSGWALEPAVFQIRKVTGC